MDLFQQQHLTLQNDLINYSQLIRLRETLNHFIRNRTSKQLLAQDSSLIQQIGQFLTRFICCGGQLQRSNEVEAIKNDQVIVMWRHILFDSDNVQIRLNMFPAESETYIHNHRNNLISMSLNGSYQHTTWTVLTSKELPKDDGSCYIERVRHSNGSLSHGELLKGKLQKSCTFEHYPSHFYYLNCQTLHTVKVKKQGERMMSLFVKDKYVLNKYHETKVMEPYDLYQKSDEVLFSCLSRHTSVQQSSEEVLSGDEKNLVLEEMESLLKEAFYSFISRDVVGSNKYIIPRFETR
ncbi:hypothetical protein FDP41_011040 [Naegleria fowleri]|uniref:Cysteine dioxygenase n=1 Tax=Naegleria fowleri TaxID=5763 RepID=A0A6A5C822_NAEFO|nr:uncharacterized protein FDP41_011040 [Naegleria fowleri]KAF0983062.1 hypothetical protein FDP41_011040 [Naegleria fowleri]